MWRQFEPYQMQFPGRVAQSINTIETDDAINRIHMHLNLIDLPSADLAVCRLSLLLQRSYFYPHRGLGGCLICETSTCEICNSSNITAEVGQTLMPVPILICTDFYHMIFKRSHFLLLALLLLAS